MIYPTIGRRVWYTPSNHDTRQDHPDRIVQHDKSLPLDAGIAYVWNERMVNLTVADQNGVMHARTSVMLLQDDEVAAPGAPFAQWMPYQVKAAS